MKQRLTVYAIVATTCVFSHGAFAQRVNVHSNTPRGGVEVKQVPGRKIGNVTTSGNVIVLELDSGVIANHNLFDLDQRTLRFTPVAGGFRVENRSLAWDTAHGPAIQGIPSDSPSSRSRFPAGHGTRSRCSTPV
jgi:hypothetical protein